MSTVFDSNRLFSFIYDYKRTNTFESYLQANASGKTIVDCGGGSGILTYLALENGATHVHCLEKETSFYNNLVTKFSGDSRVTVTQLDCFTDTLPTGDIYLHEFFGTFLWDEGIQNFVDNLNSQSITNIFPSTINIFSLEDLDFKYNTTKIGNKENLSTTIQNFLPENDSNWDQVYTYEYLNYNNKQTVYSGNILSLTDTYHTNKYWEINTSYGVFGNLNTTDTCWPFPHEE